MHGNQLDATQDRFNSVNSLIVRLDVLSKNIKLKEDEVYRASSRLKDFVKEFDRRSLDFDAKLRKLEGLPKVSNET